MRWITWTKTLLDEFIEEGNLNERQAFIMKTRVKGYTIAQQARILNLSIDQVNKDIAKLRDLYDEIAATNSILPKRK